MPASKLIIEEDIKNSSFSFENLINNTPSCLKIVNKKGELLMMNPQGLKMCGVEDYRQALGSEVYPVIADSYREEYIKYNEYICQGNKGSMIYEMIATCGKTIVLESFGAPYKLENGEYAHIAITNDITHRVRQQEIIQKQSEVLLEASRLSSLGQLSGTIAHEINNPLSVIATMSEILRMRSESETYDKDFYIEGLEKITATVNRISKIIKGIRTYSRDAKADEKQLNNLSQIIKSTLEISKEKFRLEGVELSMELDESIDLNCNEVQISQVISNLVNNSFYEVCKLDKKWIKVHLFKDGDKTKITVTDSGEGIDDQVQEKLMKPFFTTKPQGEGTGLGLSVSKKIMKEHDGLLVYNSKSKNTEFILEFN